MTAEDREALVSQAAHYMRKWEAAEAECHRLRQMYQDALRTVASSNEACATERAAHEATERSRKEATDRALAISGKLDEVVRAHEAIKEARNAAELQRDNLATALVEADEIRGRLEARVAELERENTRAANSVLEMAKVASAQLAALDQARGLLRRVSPWPGDTLLSAVDAWLRAHPAPVTPAEPVRVYGGEGMPDVVLDVEPATPAATGAELQIVECTDTPRGRAREKERGT